MAAAAVAQSWYGDVRARGTEGLRTPPSKIGLDESHCCGNLSWTKPCATSISCIDGELAPKSDHSPPYSTVSLSAIQAFGLQAFSTQGML